MRLHLILGPGRSGSSALAQRLEDRGVNFGKNLVASDPFNENGYQENPLVGGINQMILLQAGSFNGDFTHHVRAYRVLSLAEEVAMDTALNEQFRGEEMGLKCPRFCLTLPSWIPYLSTRFDRVQFYICLRNPIAVVRSLMSTGRSRRHAALWWSSHIIGAVENTQGQVREFVDFDEALDWTSNDIEERTLDLWNELRSTRTVSSQTARHWKDIFEANADWLPEASNAARSLAVIRRLAGRGSALARSVEAAFPGLSMAWSARDDYITADREVIWQHYIDEVIGDSVDVWSKQVPNRQVIAPVRKENRAANASPMMDST